MKLRHACRRLGVTFCLSLILMGFQSLVITPVAAQNLTEAENRKLEAYLRRLDLERVVVDHLEQMLATEGDAAVRKKLAERLAAVYAACLLDNQSNDDQVDDVEQGANRLIGIYPELENPLLRVAIFQAQYRKINLEFHDWWYFGQASTGKQELADNLHELIENLLQLTQRIDSRRADLAVVEQFGNVASLPGMANLENVLTHTHYLIGWASYLNSIVQSEDAQQWLDMSELHFREFLQIEPKKILVELTESWFDLDSGWTSRGLIGLAMCMQAKGQPEASQKCFDLLAHSNSVTLNQLIPLWKLKSLLFGRQTQAALDLAKSYKEFPLENRESEIRFWTTAARGGLALNVPENNVAKRLIRLAFIGLIRNMQAETIRQLIDDFNVQLPDDNFLGNWIAGYLLFVEAQSTNSKETLRQAQGRLEVALRVASDATSDPDRARCRFFLGWILFHDREFAAAEQHFQEVVNDLRHDDSAIAAQAQWYRIQSLIEISRNSPRMTNAAFAAMDQMLRWFPDAALTERVEFEKMKLNLRSLPDGEAVLRLQTISRSNASHGDALYERVQRQYRVWLKTKQLGRPDQPQYEKLSQWEREFRALPASTTQRRLRAILLVVDSQLRRNRVEDEMATSELLQVAEGYAQSLGGARSPIYLEFKYYCFLFAQKSASAEAEACADWLVQHAGDSRYEKSALVFLAQQSKLRLEAGDATVEQLQDAIAVYRRLLEVSGESVEALKSSPNSRIAMSQLALLYAQTEDWDQADELNQRLIEIFPNNRDYLLATARVKLKLGQFDTARAYWRKLATGVEAGTETWYESKYELAVCIAKSDPESALKLIRQTGQLSPNLPENWKQKFDSLESALITQ